MQLVQTLVQTMITGFSFVFSKKLLEQLKKMKEEELVFEESSEGSSRRILVADAVPIVFYLADQVKFENDFWREHSVCDSREISSNDLDRLIKTAENFLMIFKEDDACQHVSTEPMAISPKRRMEIPSKPNRSYTDVQPATLTAEEVKELLGHFSGDALKGISYLLVQLKNEPYRITPDESNSDNDQLHFIIRKSLDEQLQRVQVNGKRFRLARYLRGSKRYGFYECQLWEIKAKNNKA